MCFPALPLCASSPYHNSFSSRAVSGENSWRGTDDGGRQWRVDRVWELSKLWVLLADVLHHLCLQREAKELWKDGQ